jgi:hypothetical protein
MSNFDNTLFVDRERKYRGFQKLLQPDTRQAVMLIEAPKDMGKTWVVGKMIHHCLQPDVSLPVAQIDFRNPRQIHEIQDFLGLIRLLRNKLDAPDHFQQLNATINQLTAAHTVQPGLVTLREQLEQRFNLSELADLAFNLGNIWENLSGSTLADKSRELVVYCERHQLLPQLVELCRQKRPSETWSLDLAGPASTATTAADATSDNNAPLRADSEIERRHAERQINQAFFEGLAGLLKERGLAAFLFDSFEAAPPEAERWILVHLLPNLLDKRKIPRLGDDKKPRLVVIITGRKTPDVTDLNMRDLVVPTGLSHFNEDYIREYFEQRRNIKGLDYRTITLTSGGVPGVLALMADHAMLTQQEDDDFFSDL